MAVDSEAIVEVAEDSVTEADAEDRAVEEEVRLPVDLVVAPLTLS